MNETAYTLNLTAEQIQELHISLIERVVRLEHETQHTNQTIAEIAQRQLDRVRPLLALIEQKVFELAAG